ncbi:S8 family serine peptidase [Salipaludibacillus agaradhaerens]|uniref:S8 family serine peptidase n=1 Tax=Salipaludibacillus agaradhaerens TaxID=76935 RepID=A0A9Q4AX54_SALAG|nr:peptidoglycan-binding protein [Salipaludibacillus agaradhaerens]MCR6094941.1 S8 family serine peptidase [Salipaludibacillus agaradhaerens]MCR6115501.1 S8 family serine peptidase [Salipaludibacillus agaradhaerens]
MKTNSLRLLYSLMIVILIVFPIKNLMIEEVKAETPNDNVYVDPQLNIGSSEKIDIIVELEAPPVKLQKSEAEEKGVNFNQSVAEGAIEKEGKDFLSQLESINIDYSDLARYEESFNGFSLSLEANDINKILNFQEVIGIYPDNEYELLLEQKNKGTKDTAVELLEVTDLWDKGLSGEGVKVGVIDSGIDYHHPALSEAYKGGSSFVNDGQETPLEGHDGVRTTHGTNVSGIIAAQGTENVEFKGVAYGADLYVYRVLGNSNTGRTSDIIKAIEQAIRDDVDVINMSLGRKANEADTPLTRSINNTVKGGIPIVVANGNNGSNQKTVGDPATAELAISVGATAFENSTERVADFSSRGPVDGTYTIKPDVVAPGVGIYSTTALSSTGSESYENAFNYYSGTSMSAPYVTGVIALLLEEDSTLTPEELKVRLMNTAEPIANTFINDTGGGSVRALKAFQTPVTVSQQSNMPYPLENEEISYKTGSVNLGVLKLGGELERELTLEIMNYSEETIEYDIIWNPYYNSLNSDEFSIDFPSQVLVDGGSSKTITVNIKSQNLSTNMYVEGMLKFETAEKPHITVPIGGMTEVLSNPIKSFNISSNYVNASTTGITINYTVGVDAIERRMSVIDLETNDILGEVQDFSGNNSGDFNWDLKILSEGEEKKLTDGNYKIILTAHTESDHFFQKGINLTVSSVAPTTELKSLDLTDNLIEGKILSPFSDDKMVTEALTVEFSLQQEQEEYYASGSVTLAEDGSFNIKNKLHPGSSILTINSSDIAGNKNEETFNINWSGEFSEGDRGVAIEAFKEKMRLLGFEVTNEDKDFFGSEMKEKLLALQGYYSLDITGHIDKKTQKDINKILTTSFKDGQNSPAIQEFKQTLTILGFGTFPDNPSYNYGLVTKRVVEEFQLHYGLIANGIGDSVTLSKMEELLGQTLKDGDDNEQVKELKVNLTSLGFGNFPTNPSKRYGAVTERVVKDFQRTYGLRESGSANPLTLEKIQSLLNRSYKNGDQHDDISMLKKDLTSLGYGNFPRSPSPVYGKVTQAVVEEFQKDNNMPVTGVADANFFSKINYLRQIVYKSGDDSAEIRELKNHLTFLGFGNFPSNPSPRYGSVTTRIIKEFQSYYGLEKTGDVNRQTLNIIEQNISTIYQVNNSAPEIRELKKQLTKAGFGNFPSNPSVHYGSVTERVMREYQAHHNLIQNGIGDKITLQKLFE